MSPKQSALLFPGQGAHDVTMLGGVAAAKGFAERYDLICRVLAGDPAEELRKGNRDYLNQNKVSSLLTVLVSSLSLDLYLEITDVKPKYYAGYSVGQWTALYAAGAISFPILIDAVSARADAMDACCKETPGAMMAFIGVRQAALEEFLQGIREQGYSIAISNYNCLGQYSVAGTKEAIEIAYANAGVLNPRKAVILPVQGAWHCQLLEPAEKAFAAYLDGIQFSPLQVPAVDAITGNLLPSDPESIKKIMARHISHPVQWQTGIQYLIKEGCDDFIEIGYGNVLTKFGFFIDRDKSHRSFYTA